MNVRGASPAAVQQLTPEDAEKFHREETERKSRELGAGHQETIASIEQVGVALERQGRHADAEQVYRELAGIIQEAAWENCPQSIIAMNRVAVTLAMQGRQDETERLLFNNLRLLKQSLPLENQVVLDSTTLYACSLQDIREHAEAERIHRELLVFTQASLYDTHPKAFECLVHIIECLRVQGLMEESDSMIARAESLTEIITEKDELRTLLHVNNIGTIMTQRGRHADAERLHRRALNLIEKGQGKEHQAAISTLKMLAGSLTKQERHGEAEEMLKIMLERAEKTLGEQHLWTQECMFELGASLCSQMKVQEAEEVLRRLLALRHKVDGPGDLLMLMIKSMLGQVLVPMGHDQEAAELLHEVLEPMVEFVGEESPAVIETIEALAMALYGQGRYKESADNFKRLLDLQVRTLGPENPEALRTMNRMAEAIRYQGLIKQSAQVHYQAHWLMQSALGEEHPSTLLNLTDLAGVLLQLQHYVPAEQMFRRLSQVFEKQVGESHMWTIQAKANLGLVLNLQTKFAEGQPLLRQAVEEMERILGRDNPSLLRSMHHLALVAYMREEYAEAEDIHRQVIEAQGRILGPDHPSTLDSKSGLALVFNAQGKFEEAADILRTAVEGLETVLGDDHPSTIERMNNLGMVLDNMKLHDESKQTFSRSFDLTQRVLLDESDQSGIPGDTNMLCKICVHAFTSPLYTDGSLIAGSQGHEELSHYENMAQLMHSAKTCPLCRDIRDAAFSLAKEKDLRDHEIRRFRVYFHGVLGTNYKKIQQSGIHIRGVNCYAPPREQHLINFVARVFGPEDEITQRAIYRRDDAPSETLVQERLGLVRSWLHGCRKEHTQCSSSESETKTKLVRPTRLIDLGLPQHNQDPSPRLVDVADIDPSIKIEYTALSYCWGVDRCPEAMTTRSSEESHRQQIVFSSLPKTFRDAMTMTAAVGIRFIWIDSLCIIQEDREDWAREAATMSSVYQGCSLVLAAASSLNAHGGLFLDTWRQPKQYKYLSPGKEEEIPVEMWQDIGDTFKPLSTRAWTLQETLLARRVVFFTRDQTYWQCRTHTHSEDATVHESTEYRLHRDICIRPLDFGNRWTSCDHWWAWVTNYTSRQLSHPSDYMAAFAGITQYFSDRTGTPPALGIWADYMLAFGLGWSTHDVIGLHSGAAATVPSLPRRSVIRNLPSWSWFRYQMPIYGHLFSGHGTAQTRLVSFDVAWSGTPMVSDVSSSRLVVRGPVRTLALVPQAAPRRGQFCSFTEPHQACFLDEGVSSVETDEGGFFEAPCLLLSMQPNNSFATFMVLEEVPVQRRRRRKTYRRIGIGQFAYNMISHHPFLGVEGETLKLV